MKIFYSEPITYGRSLINCGVKNFLVTAYNRTGGKLVSEVLSFVKRFPEYNFSDCNLLIDSGAFSEWNRVLTDLPLFPYLKECQYFEEVIAPLFKSVYYINLDRIPGQKGMNRDTRKLSISEAQDISFKNYEKLGSELGYLKVIPVIHYDEDYTLVEQYASYNNNYLCLAPDESVERDGDSPWMTQIWIRKPEQIKVHGLAVTGFNVNLNYPFYSVDSTSWLLPAKTGKTNYWDFLTKKEAKRLKNVRSIKELNFQEFIINSPQARKTVENIEKNNEVEQLEYQIHYFQYMEYVVTKRFEYNQIYPYKEAA